MRMCCHDTRYLTGCHSAVSTWVVHSLSPVADSYIAKHKNTSRFVMRVYFMYGRPKSATKRMTNSRGISHVSIGLVLSKRRKQLYESAIHSVELCTRYLLPPDACVVLKKTQILSITLASCPEPCSLSAQHARQGGADVSLS